MRSEILKRIVSKNKKEDVLHSSGYAKVQNGSGIGVSSTESFEERRKIDLNRKLVKGYGDSKMINDIGRHTAKLRVGIRKDLEKREERFGARDDRNNLRKNVDSRFASGNFENKMNASTKRAAMPRKNPGIFR